MATWEDGPEYAPVERPAEFVPAAAAPLPVAAHPLVVEGAPTERPRFDQPRSAVTPLAQIAAPVPDHRDPTEAFAVVSSTMTAPRPGDSAWGSLRWAPPTGQPVVAGPPTPVLSGPSTVMPAAPGWQPSPGGPYQPAPYAPTPVPATIGAKEVIAAATPGLCLCLAIGGLVYVVAPIMLAIAVGLSGRVQVAKQQVRRTFLIGLAVLAAVAALTGLSSSEDFGAWWAGLGSWALAICWVLLVATLALTYRGLKSAGSPPANRSWR